MKIKGNLLNTRQINEYLFDTPVWCPKRIPANNYDFGDSGTLGMHLKRSNIKFQEFDNEDFGIFLGEHDEKWVIGILDDKGYVVSGEYFDSLEELKQAWELD